MTGTGIFNTYGFRGLAAGVFLCLLLGLVLPVYAGDPFSFTGSWNHRKTGGDSDSSSAFSHSYNLTYSKELSQFMDLSASVRYNENRPSEGENSSSTSPSLSIDTRNDLFFLNLGASRNELERDGSPKRTTDTLGTTFYTLVEDLPTLRLFYTTSENYDDGSPRFLDTKSDTYGGGIEYGLYDFDALYDYRFSETDNRVADSKSENTEHLAQLKYSRSFFDNRLSISASQQYQRNETTTTIGGGRPLPLVIRFAYSGVDTTPENGLPSLNPGLINGTASVDITKIEDQALAAEIETPDGSPLQIDTLRLEVVQPEDVLNNRNFFENRANWEVYQSFDDGDNWTEVLDFFPSVSSDGSFVTFSFDLTPLTQRYVKIVSRIPEAPLANLLPVVNATRLEAFFNRPATAPRQTIRTRLVSQQTEFTASVHPSDDWQGSYSMRFSKSEQENGIDNRKWNHAVNVTYFPTDLLTISMGVSQSTDKSDDSAERKSRNYTISANAELLPTLDLSLGYTRTETTGADLDDVTSDNINMIVNTIFYPDWTASLNNSWRRVTRQDGGEATAIGTTLNTTAQLTPKLDATLVASYFYTENKDSLNDVNRDDSSTRYTLSGNYRPSDILLLSGSFSQNIDENQNFLSGTASVLASPKVQMLFGSTFEFGDTEREQYNATLTWLLSQAFSFQSSGTYSSTEDADSWSLFNSLTANF